MSDTTYHRVGQDPNANRSPSYSFWTWFVAALAAIALLWAWHHDHWPNSGCCNKSAPAAVSAPAEPFSFTAGSHEDFAASGDKSGIAWLSSISGLEDWLSKGKDWRIEGDASNVTLTGTVDSEATKTTRGEEAAAFFGPNVMVDNQLAVVEALPTIEATPDPVVAPIEPEATKPDTAKVYFDVGFHALPSDAPATLAKTIEHAKANADSKVVVSGYHDPTGNQAMNIELSKNRAKSVYRYLLSAGIPESRLELREPQNVEGGSDYKEARRAEVTIE